MSPTSLCAQSRSSVHRCLEMVSLGVVALRGVVSWHARVNSVAPPQTGPKEPPTESSERRD